MMLRDYSQRISLLYLIISIQLIQASDYHRENLALRHPCNSINKRLEPYIQWTEKLASSQYGGKTRKVNIILERSWMSGCCSSDCRECIVNQTKIYS